MNGNNDCGLTINERKKIFTFVILQSLIVIAVAGCKSPFDRTRDASGTSGTGAITGTHNLVVFSNELKTGGGAFLYPGGDNQILSFTDSSNPISARSIRYTWNGQNVAAQNVFAGFDLMHTPTQAEYDATTAGRDLHAANYRHVNFYARGSLSSNTFLKVEVADDGNTATAAPCVALSLNGDLDSLAPATPCGVKERMSGDWGPHSIPIANGNLLNVRDFFKATIICNQNGGNIPCQGGTVLFDQIEYAP